MKKNLLISIAAVCGLSTLCSCHGDVLNVDAQEPEPTSVLHVFTRSADPTLAENVPTPVSLYVFNASNTCVGLLSDVTQNALVFCEKNTAKQYNERQQSGQKHDRGENRICLPVFIFSEISRING